MTSPIDTSTPRKRFPKWTLEEQDVWLNSFEAYAAALMQLHIDTTYSGGDWDDDEIAPPIKALTPEEIEVFESDITLAASLADRAVMEVLYRFHIQEGVKRKRPPVKKRGRR